MTIIDRIHQFDRFGMVLGLERMEVLLQKLGSPHKGIKAIHVAGTNGKGSVCRFLEEALTSLGYRTALYSSPYIERFNERIRLGGEDISDEDLETYGRKAVHAAEEMVAEGLDSPTEFEVVTAIAFLYFKEKGADFTILEVGLGGSGDSTNVIADPVATVITSISYDHMDRLGDTLYEIASEKAGILKEGSPCISNAKDMEAKKAIARAAYEKKAVLYDISDMRFHIGDADAFGQTVSMEMFGKDYSDINIKMTGLHQAENLKTAVAVLEILRSRRIISVDRDRLYDGLERACQMGRFEVVRDDGPMVILDGAHNEAGAEALENTVKAFLKDRSILLITGILADKDVDGILEHFTAITGDIIVTEPDNPRKMKEADLAARIGSFGIDAMTASSMTEDEIRKSWESHDAVIFAGSLYLIGKVRRILKDGEKGNEK